MDNFFHSVTLDKELCKGCINCIKRCPTEAIRVRNGKARIMPERCIDCGECIRICPHHAKKPIYDPLSILENGCYNIALPAPSLYAQFNNLDEVDILLQALRDLGFDDIYEVAKAAEIVSDITRHLMKTGKLTKPVISSACPAVTRLIRVRFPNLIDNVLPVNSPAELAARLAKKKAQKETGLPVDKIKAIFISPCAAKVTAVKMPLGTEKSNIDYVVAIKEIYPRLLPLMQQVKTPRVSSETGKIGVGWGISEGESSALLNLNYLAADGIENVIKVLEEVEDEKLQKLDFIELNACSGGCVGGVLTVENPYIARTRMKKLKKSLPVALNHITREIPKEAQFDEELTFSPVLTLDEDLSKAMDKLQQIEEITARLPGLDCGSCGAPTCRALAEDVVRGYGSESDCIYKYKEQMDSIFHQMSKLQGYTPEVLRQDEKKK